MFAERLACELQTYFRSSLLSLRNFRRERSDNPKYVCSPQATERWNRAEYNSFVIRYAKNLGWSGGLIVHVKLYESCISTQLPNNSSMFFFSFCLLPSSSIFPPFLLFSYLVAPLPVLPFQEAKMFRSWCPYKIFQALFLITNILLLSFLRRPSSHNTHF